MLSVKVFEADEQEDPCQRLAYVAAFAFSIYGNLTRILKPFNPYL
jgi:hypothetical protein